MKMSIEEYWEKNPIPRPETGRQDIEKTARIYEDRQQAAEEIERLKDSITNQLERGNDLQYILYTALTLIGLLTNDTEWAEAGQGILSGIYEGLEQQSLLTDNAAIAAQRLEGMQAAYNEKLRRQLTRSINGYKRIEKALQEALKAVDELDPQEDISG